jgi:hypothetical protein
MMVARIVGLGLFGVALPVMMVAGLLYATILAGTETTPAPRSYFVNAPD